MKLKMTILIALGFAFLFLQTPIAQAQAAEGTWVVGDPDEDEEYYTSSVPIDVTYDWGTGTTAAVFDFSVKGENGAGWMHTETLTQTNPDATSLKSVGTMNISRVVGPGTPCTITIKVQDISGNTLSTKTISIKVKTFD